MVLRPANRRRRGEGNDVIASSRTLSEMQPQQLEVALLHIFDQYDFSLSILQTVLLEAGLKVDFSHIKYKDIAPFVGLDPPRDIGTFELHRSRIPTELLRSIIQDMDIMLFQYGPLSAHETQRATSRFLAPIFNRLIAEFGFAFRNVPDSIIQCQAATNGRIVHYLRAFGSVSVLIVEAKLKVGHDKERLDAIAHVIAECVACDWNSGGNFVVPLFGILWDGTFFQFFQFDGTTKPYSFHRGAFSGDPPNLRKGLKLPDLTPAETTLPFIRSLRWISETIFDLLLSGYVSSIEAFRERSVTRSARESLDKWDDALNSAQKALECFRDAETKRQKKDRTGANQAVLEAQIILKRSIETVPIIDDENILIMPGWDDDDIELA